jgi:hypothetical protein
MRASEKRHWMVVLVYTGLLCLSLLLFPANPEWRIGRIAWNAAFQLLGSTIGTGILLAGKLTQMVGARVSVLHGVVTVVLLAGVSFVCLALTIPIMHDLCRR